MSLYGRVPRSAYAAVPHSLGPLSVVVRSHGAFPPPPSFPNFPSMPTFPSRGYSSIEHLQDAMIRENHRQIVSLMSQRQTPYSSPYQNTLHNRPYTFLDTTERYTPPIIYSQANRLAQALKEHPLLPDAKPLPKTREIKKNLRLAKITRRINRLTQQDPLFLALEQEKIKNWENTLSASQHYKSLKKRKASSTTLEAQERKIRNGYRQAQTIAKESLPLQLEQTASVYERFPSIANGLIRYLEKERAKDEAFISPRISIAPTRVRVRTRNGTIRPRVRTRNGRERQRIR